MSDTFATSIAGLIHPLSQIIEVLKSRTEGQALNTTARILGCELDILYRQRQSQCIRTSDILQ